MTEDTKRREEAVEATKGQLSDILKGLGFKDVPDSIELGSLRHYPSGYQLNLGPDLHYSHLPTTGLITYEFSGKEGVRAFTATVFVSSEYEAGSEEGAEESISAYLAQIDQSRAQAQATQPEIDQLRTETRELISKLLAA